MLRALSIRHFAIIDALELEFEPGFTAITGETGAGKSILIDAMGLLLGDRADSNLIADGKEQAELSARFELADGSRALAWLKEQALAEDQELVVRRLLSARGTSRAWINGRPATIGQLAELGELLVEIHGQHEHQRLERSETQRQLLDQQVDPALPQQVRDRCQQWQACVEALSDFERECGNPEQIDLLRFQVRELDDLALAPGEFARLESEQERLARSDELRAAVARAAAALDLDEQASVRSLLLEAIHAINGVRELDERLHDVGKLLDEARINIDEAIAELERHEDTEESDPKRLEQLDRRLQKTLDLARKHRTEPDALPELAARLRQRLERLEDQDQARDRLEKAMSEALSAWRVSAAALSDARRLVAARLEQDVAASLARLGMERARLRIDVEARPEAEPTAHGQDRIAIQFSANPGQAPRPLARVASGGELSRISLALMLSAGPGDGAMVRVFDEVDAGIGGETAEVVGRFLRQVAERGQAFCVTHLAQVAARADHQVRVHKSLAEDNTELSVDRLDRSERRREIARMLGNPDSDRSLAHAEELLEQR
ncbi:MAG: DNA repair protein RecN [Wenzhouxiangella sp.]|nr:DNA repair protein RecN [Wenzhouxiangella sp.]